jgi:hypothetical protein
MADRKGLRFIGFVFGAVTAVISLIATFVVSIEPAATEQSLVVVR